jgi:mannose-6-phosphate isomerase-like protein (cupin superfamily)
MELTKELLTTSYLHEPEQPFQPSDTSFHFEHLTTFYDVPGEFGHFLEGQHYGFEALSVIITETHPGGGPPLHTHACEEAHILLEGRVRYILGDERFTIEAPYIVKIRAGVPHAFLNVEAQPIRMICPFPTSQFSYEELGPNPLLAEGRESDH